MVCIYASIYKTSFQMANAVILKLTNVRCARGGGGGALFCALDYTSVDLHVPSYNIHWTVIVFRVLPLVFDNKTLSYYFRRTPTGQFLFLFDIKDFHSVVLVNGAMPISVLESVVQEWIEASKNTPLPSSNAHTLRSLPCVILMSYLIVSIVWMCVSCDKNTLLKSYQLFILWTIYTSMTKRLSNVVFIMILHYLSIFSKINIKGTWEVSICSFELKPCKYFL